MDELRIARADTLTETDRKCPECGGTMDFDPKTGGMACPYCGHKEAIPLRAEEPSRAEELSLEDAEHTGNCDWGMAKKRVLCKSCGAESIYDALQVSSECPYCGSNQVMEVADKDTLAPGGVCPFAMDAKTAVSGFARWIRRRWFCPSAAKKSAKPEAMKGVYLPYWTFDANTDSDYTARYGIAREEKDSAGKTKTTVIWYSTSGRYERFIDDLAMPGTDRHDATVLRRIEPFNTADNVIYKPEYMAGFLSERYTLGLKDAWQRGKDKICSILNEEIESQIRTRYGADQISNLAVSTTFSNLKYKYLMLPVWMSSFKYNGKTYQFMVNGQTGKVGGKTPISIPRVTLAILLGIGVIALFAWLYSNGQ